jgi:glutamate/tyrosine decarboxylase-like PLP-dependent enzyme
VALGVSYPLGALLQGPVADAVGIGWTTAGSAFVLVLAGLVALWRWPGFAWALIGRDQAGPGDDVVLVTTPDMAR